MKKILIIAGEASGDLHGSKLIQSLKQKDHTIEIHAVGGHHVKAEQCASFINMAHLNVTGFTEVLRYLPHYFWLFHQIRGRIGKIRPDLVVFIDNPGFNLRLAQKIQHLKIPMVYYICPQVWAWNRRRIHRMKRLFRQFLVIFDFEEAFYKQHGMNACWVGHPLKDVIEVPQNDKPKVEGDLDGKRIVLMPGSRKNEVELLLPILLKAAETLKKKIPSLFFLLLKADTLPDEYYERLLSKTQFFIQAIRKNKYEAMQQADLAILCSGTATAECLLCHLPMIVVYRASWITHLLAQKLAHVRYLALPNLIADEPVVPELLQYDCNPKKIAAAALDFLENPVRRSETREKLATLSSRLGEKGAADRTATALLKELRQ